VTDGPRVAREPCALFAHTLGALLTVYVAAVTLASPAAAHASFVAASPSPGRGLPQAPAAVVLRFNEPLNLPLSSVEVRDADGRDVTEGGTQPVEGDESAMRRRLALLPPGEYTVRWETVSTLDGHRLHGTYTFGIATATLGNEQVAASPLASEGWLGLAGRFAALVGLTLWSGTILLRRTALRAGLPPPRLRRLTRLGPTLALAGTAASVLSAALLSAGTPAAVAAVLSSQSGRLRATVLVAAALAVVTPVAAWPLAALLAAVAVVAEAASGHAAGTTVPVLAAASFGVHLVAAGVWVVALLAAARSAQPLRTALKPFTRWAVAAAAVVAGTGTVNTVVELESPGQLLTTGYGRAVLGKILLFAVMVALGALHYRRRRRPESGDAPRLRLPVRAELVAAVGALALAALLVGFPNTPREQAVAASSAEGGLSVLAEGEVLSVAAASGDVVVALSLLPPAPGEVEVRVHVEGVEAGDAVLDVTVQGSSDRGDRFTARLDDDCGFGCFRGTADVPAAGEWRLDVSAASNRAPLGFTTRVPLPAPDGSGELERALAAMNALDSARMTETLRGAVGAEIIRSEYTFEAPDAMRFEVVGASVLVVVDDRAASRELPDGEWDFRDWPEPGYSWPQAYYTEFWAQSAAAARIVGQETVDGVLSNVLTFVRPDVNAWFRLSVGRDDGLVRRLEMRAHGHLMDHDYTRFNAPVDIALPEAD
jgi:copper transport protein